MQLRDQLRVINEDYAGIRVSFQLKGITRTTNQAWYDTGDELAMKAALRKGGYNTLNVYFLGFIPDPKEPNGLLGRAMYPQKILDQDYDDGWGPGKWNYSAGWGPTLQPVIPHSPRFLSSLPLN